MAASMSCFGAGSGMGAKAKSKIKSGESYCRCKPIVAPTRKLYVAKRFDYVIKAKVKTVEVIGELTIAQVQVNQVLKMTQVQVLPRAVSLLWTVSGCACPTLTTQAVYLVMGHDDPSNNRLLFDERAVAVPWKKGFAKKIQRWERHLLRRQKGKGKDGNGKPKPSKPDQMGNVRDEISTKKKQTKAFSKLPAIITTLRPSRRKHKPLTNVKT